MKNNATLFRLVCKHGRLEFFPSENARHKRAAREKGAREKYNTHRRRGEWGEGANINFGVNTWFNSAQIVAMLITVDSRNARYQRLRVIQNFRVPYSWEGARVPSTVEFEFRALAHVSRVSGARELQLWRGNLRVLKRMALFTLQIFRDLWYLTGTLTDSCWHSRRWPRLQTDDARSAFCNGFSDTNVRKNYPSFLINPILTNFIDSNDNIGVQGTKWKWVSYLTDGLLPLRFDWCGCWQWRNLLLKYGIFTLDLIRSNAVVPQCIMRFARGQVFSQKWALLNVNEISSSKVMLVMFIMRVCRRRRIVFFFFDSCDMILERHFHFGWCLF